MRLVKDAKHAWKWASVRLGALATVLATIVLNQPDLINLISQHLTPAQQSFVVIGGFICVVITRCISFKDPD